MEQNAPTLSNEFLSYHQSTKDLSELLGLIIDMIGRGVDDLKIAQTVMFRNQGKNSEDDILQIIDSIKDFIALCISKTLTVCPMPANCRGKKTPCFIWRRATHPRKALIMDSTSCANIRFGSEGIGYSFTNAAIEIGTVNSLESRQSFRERYPSATEAKIEPTAKPTATSPG